MTLSSFKSKHAFLLALLVSALLILRQYTDFLINDYEYEFSWFAVATRIAINYLIWASFFRALVRLGQFFQKRETTIKTVLYQLVASILIAGVHRLLSVRFFDLAYYGYSGFLRDFINPWNKVAIGVGLFSSFLEYWIIMTLILGFSYYARYTEQLHELNSAKLNALRMQLQPHFLFNTLNSITSLIDIDSKKAQKMLTQLGFLMRELLEHDKKHFISLESELEYTKAYLEIEYIRFQDRLSLQFEIDEQTLKAQVPALIMQPIVENAIKHGIAKNPEGGVISLKSNTIIRNGKIFLSLIISNDLPKVSVTNNRSGYGIGTRNVEKRLMQLYGIENHTYSHYSNNEKYFSEFIIPFEAI